MSEIRDLDTAELAIKAAQRPPLLSTLHTNMRRDAHPYGGHGVKPYAIATSVSLIIAQRLRAPVLTASNRSPSRMTRCFAKDSGEQVSKTDFKSTTGRLRPCTYVTRAGSASTSATVTETIGRITPGAAAPAYP